MNVVTSPAMPFDLAPACNTPTATLELQQAQPLGDGQYFAAFLIVRAGVFSAALPFVFTKEALDQFEHELEALARDARGEARLLSRDGETVLQIAMSGDAGIRVSGDLRDPDEPEQLLRFAFTTVNQMLTALRAGLKRLRDSSA